MKEFFLDILFLNEDAGLKGKYQRANWLGIFLVTTWIIFAWQSGSDQVSKYFGWDGNNDMVALQSKLDGIAEDVRVRDFEAARSTDELDQALREEYEAAFNERLASEKQKHTAKFNSLREELEGLSEQCSKYPAALDRHRG